MDAADEERPVRLLARYLSDYLFASADRWIELTGGDPLDTLLVRTVFGSNLAHLPYRDGASWYGLSTTEPERRVAINAVSASLGLPFETVRLRIKALRDSGILERSSQGLSALGTVRGHPHFPALVAREAASLRAFVATIGRDAYDPDGQMLAGAEALGAIPEDVVARLVLDLGLRCVEHFVAVHGGIQQGIVTTALVAANVRHILEDVALSKRFAFHDNPPPDTLREPVTIRALQRELGMPFETVRRQVHALAARGVTEQRGDGWIVPNRVLMEPGYEQLNTRNAQQLMRLVETAIRLAEG